MTPRALATILCGSLALLLSACGPVQAAGAAATSAWLTSGASTAEAAAAERAATAASPARQVTNRPAGWSDASHGEDATPDYAVVFPDNEVRQLTITVTPENWATMQANMTELFGERGAQRGPGGPGGPGGPPPVDGAMPAPPDGMAPPDGPAPGPGGPGGADMTPENPVWVPAVISYNGETWTQVGVRYKGNSSLRGAWSGDSLKLPFKLDFDEFEDDFPEIKNQRFYGFDQLSLGNNFSDASWMRDSLAYDLLDAAGLVAARTAFYDVVLDYGEGPVNLGIYTAVEVVDDTVVARAFGDDTGNIYEADGRAATLAAGVQGEIPSSFQKENNKNSDWSDIERLYSALHSPTRTSDPAAWRSELDSIFDVGTFLRWLALSGAMQHWDTYGAMTHNYYLYSDPATGKLTWISWDHNMILSAGGGPGGPGGPRPELNARPTVPADGAQPAARQDGQRPGRGMGPGRSVTLDKQTVTESWPLIRFLLDDPVYHAAYVSEVASISDDVFTPEQLEAKYQTWAAALAPYADRDGVRAEFDAAVQALTTRTYEQGEAVRAFRATQPGH